MSYKHLQLPGRRTFSAFTLGRMAVPALVLLAFGLGGCGKTGQRVIGVVPKGANHIFWQTVHAGAVKAGREFGFEIEWNAPTLEIDASRQIGIIESMVNRRLAGIALAPVDRQALVGIVERAADERIPVAIFDSGIDTPRRIAYVATDNVEAGRMAARRMGEALGGKGKVAIIGFMPGSASTMERESGFQDSLQLLYPEVTIVGMQFAMADRAKAMAATENLLNAHPDLAGIYADNESSSSGAVQALKSRKSKALLVAMDASDQLIADMKAGYIDSIVVQNPFKMGYESVRAIALKIRGEGPLNASIDSGAMLIRPSDLDKPDVRALLYPGIEKYLK